MSDYEIVERATTAFPPGWSCIYMLQKAQKGKMSKQTKFVVTQTSEDRWTCAKCVFRVDCEHIKSVRRQTNQPDLVENCVEPLVL